MSDWVEEDNFTVVEPMEIPPFQEFEDRGRNGEKGKRNGKRVTPAKTSQPGPPGREAKKDERKRAEAERRQAEKQTAKGTQLELRKVEQLQKAESENTAKLLDKSYLGPYADLEVRKDNPGMLPREFQVTLQSRGGIEFSFPGTHGLRWYHFSSIPVVSEGMVMALAYMLQHNLGRLDKERLRGFYSLNRGPLSKKLESKVTLNWMLQDLDPETFDIFYDLVGRVNRPSANRAREARDREKKKLEEQKVSGVFSLDPAEPSPAPSSAGKGEEKVSEKEGEKEGEKVAEKGQKRGRGKKEPLAYAVLGPEEYLAEFRRRAQEEKNRRSKLQRDHHDPQFLFLEENRRVVIRLQKGEEEVDRGLAVYVKPMLPGQLPIPDYPLPNIYETVPICQDQNLLHNLLGSYWPGAWEGAAHHAPVAYPEMKADYINMVELQMMLPKVCLVAPPVLKAMAKDGIEINPQVRQRLNATGKNDYLDPEKARTQKVIPSQFSRMERFQRPTHKRPDFLLLKEQIKQAFPKIFSTSSK